MDNGAQIDVDFSAVQSLGDRLLDQLNVLRDAAPIYWSEQQKAWIISGHAEVAAGFQGKVPLSAKGRMRRVLTFISPSEAKERIPYIMETAPRFLMSLDPPQHSKLRKFMIKAFSKRIAESHRSAARDIVDRTLSAVTPGKEIEFVETVGRQIPGNMILDLMGLSEEYLPRLRSWSAITSGLGGGRTTMDVLDQAETALLDMREVFLKEIHERTIRPQDDFISALVTTEVDGEQMNEEDVLATCYLTLIAGHDTTLNTITLGTLALARDPDAWAFVRENPDHIDDAIMEIMRYIAMSTTMVRIAARDFEWNGNKIREGDLVYLMIASANRDPDVYRNPNRMDFTHDHGQDMTFGPGIHFCIGSFFAKMQLSEYFSELVRRFDGVEVLDRELDWATSIGFRGLRSLNMRMLT